MERKNLKETHLELVRMKREKIAEAQILVQRRIREFTQSIDLIAGELGIDKGQLKLWRLNKTDEYLEKVGVTKTTVKKKGKKR